jgi:hypothetical protein
MTYYAQAKRGDPVLLLTNWAMGHAHNDLKRSTSEKMKPKQKMFSHAS